MEKLDGAMMSSSNPKSFPNAVALVGNPGVELDATFKSLTGGDPVFSESEGQTFQTSTFANNCTLFKFSGIGSDERRRQAGDELCRLRKQFGDDLKIAFVVRLAAGRPEELDVRMIQLVLHEFHCDMNNQFGVVVDSLPKPIFLQLRENTEGERLVQEILTGRDHRTGHWHYVLDESEPDVKGLEKCRQDPLCVFLRRIGDRNAVCTGTVDRKGNTPAFSRPKCLNFNEEDESGNPVTPEGWLKREVLSDRVPAAAGSLVPACGIVGMAGVGKTVALRGLAFDQSIQEQFTDGVLYISLGKDATSRDVIRQIAKVVSLAAPRATIEAVKEAGTVEDAVDFAAPCFKGKSCLFLVDDVWRTESCRTGFLPHLRQLLRECPESRMAISTRSRDIAEYAGCVVECGVRDRLGSAAVQIFMVHTGRREVPQDTQRTTGDLRESLKRILSFCSGLPLALAVAGSSVALLTKRGGDFDCACDSYAAQLADGKTDLGEQENFEGDCLNAAIFVSLEIVEMEFSKLQNRNTFFSNHTITDLYASLCVMKNQACVPVSVLCLMWQVEEHLAAELLKLLSQLSLCRFTDGGVELHDLQLEFCKQQAKKMKVYSFWHVKLMNGYFEPKRSTVVRSVFEKCDSLVQTVWRSGAVTNDQKALNLKPRKWWEVLDDGYIHGNVCRHLSSAGEDVELASLLLDARWTFFRGAKSGVLALEADFGFAKGCESLAVIWQAARRSWGRFSDGRREFLFYMSGLLFNLRASNAMVDAYLVSLEKWTPLPYVLPVSSFFPNLEKALILEIPMGSDCRTIDFSPCGRYIAVGTKNDVVVADGTTGDILQRCKAGTELVQRVWFCSGSKEVMWGCSDGSVAVWEWGTADSCAVFRRGCRSRAFGFSSDGQVVLSRRSDCTNTGRKYLRITNANNGAKFDEIRQEDEIMAAAVGADNRTVAVGLRNGTLKVLDCIDHATISENTLPHGNGVHQVLFSANGQRLIMASLGNTIVVWDTANWTAVGEPFKVRGGWELGVSPDGEQVISGSPDGIVQVWDADTGTNVWTSPKLHSPVTSLAVSPNGKRIVSGSADGIVRIWDARVKAETKEREDIARVLTVALCEDGHRVASGSSDGTVRLWDCNTGKQIGPPLEGHQAAVESLSISPDGRQVVSCDNSGTVMVANTKTFKQVSGFLELQRDDILDPGGSGRGKCCVSYVSCVAFSFDGQRIISGSQEGTVCIWNSKSGKQIGDSLAGNMGPLWHVAESSDGKFIVARDSLNETFIWTTDSRALVWKSKFKEGGTAIRNDITEEIAENIIRGCGQHAPGLWPGSFPPYAADAYVHNSNVYACDTLVGSFPSECLTWKYNHPNNLLVAVLLSGAVAICKFQV